MSKFTALSQFSKKSVLRNRSAVAAVALGTSLALGAGVAAATEDGGKSAESSTVLAGSATHVTSALSTQADAQQKAGEAEQQAAEERAKAEAEKKAKEKRAARSTKRAALGPNSWTKPLDKYTLGSTFGLAGSRWSNSHSGQDFAVPTGTPVKAAHAGKVVKAGPNGGGDGPAYGNAIVIKHDGRTFTQYAHLSRIGVHVGQKVDPGQVIGRAGSTGNSTGPHLHFEVRNTPNYGSAVEPLKFLRGHGIRL